MHFQSPLQLYAAPDAVKILEAMQLQWQGRGVQEVMLGVFRTIAEGEVSGLQILLQWLNAPIIYDEVAMRKLMSLRDATGANVFREGFLNYLQRFRFNGEVWSVAEGTLVSAGAPILQLKGEALAIANVQLWAHYLVKPSVEFQPDINFLQIRRFYNSEFQIIQDVIYSLENQPIVNFEAASWEDLLQPVKIINPK